MPYDGRCQGLYHQDMATDEFIKQGFHPTNSSFFPFVVSPLPTIYSRLRTYAHTCASCICTLPIILSSHTALCSPSLGSLTDLCFSYQIPSGDCLETSFLLRYTLLNSGLQLPNTKQNRCPYPGNPGRRDTGRNFRSISSLRLLQTQHLSGLNPQVVLRSGQSL